MTRGRYRRVGANQHADDTGVDVFVASAGGHLTQLLALREELGLSKRCVWVTYDTVQGRELASREPVIFGHGPSTRNLPAAFRNASLAKQILAAYPVTRVVSTGAGIAVPFLAQAARGGVDALYVESATRTDGPSLSGRILEPLPGVACAAQWPWGRRGWREVRSVFDGFHPEASRRQPGSSRQILVTLGTHRGYRFDRLVEKVASLVRPNDSVVWQLGCTPAPVGARQIIDGVGPAQFDALVERSDVIIGHAGLGTALAVMKRGKYPILVPRRSRHREHVDDHQRRLAQKLQSIGLAMCREVEELDVDDLRLCSTLAVKEDTPKHANATSACMGTLTNNPAQCDLMRQ